MSSNSQLRQQAEEARKQKNWSVACDRYSELLKAEYGDDSELTVQICQDLTEYAYCLLRETEPDLKAAWECLENAKKGYLEMKEEDIPPTGLTDVYEFLAEIGVKNRAYEEASAQYLKILEIVARKPDLSWRIGLNAHYMNTICLEAVGKINEAIESASKTIDFAQEAKAKNEKDAAEIDDIAKSIVIKRAALTQKLGQK